ncbi:hypothetical protein ABZ023_30315 [Streptomyces sp. NPDC006367]|uniref:hypothetical protein n=1 Tax=unclassified Streptomyces TaxID=2593676 RepID=UPI00339FD1ED
MTEERTPWVGDQVHDAEAGKEGVVTDVRNGTYILREVHSWSLLWTVPDAERLTVVMTREERIKREREN